MQFKQIFICKPGCNLQPKPNKTNLQLRELEALQAAFKDINIDAKLTTIADIAANALSMQDCAIICFNSAKCFDNELVQLLMIASVIDGLDLTFVSNDVRLGFKLYTEHSKWIDRICERCKNHELSIRILTNASNKLDEYIDEICDWPLRHAIPIDYAPLWTLPAYLRQAKQSAKSVPCIYACMHFSDYSEQRQSDLLHIKQALGDKLQLVGDVSGMVIAGNEQTADVIDAADMPAIYVNAAATPILLEPKYDYYGVMPNRASEAIASNCIPLLITSNIANYDNMDNTAIFAVQGKLDVAVQALLDISTQYDSKSVQQRLVDMHIGLAFNKTVLCTQLATIFN